MSKVFAGFLAATLLAIAVGVGCSSGGKIRGFDRQDAVDAVQDVLSDRHPTIRSTVWVPDLRAYVTEDVREFTDLNSSCWDYVRENQQTGRRADPEVLVDVTDQSFIVTLGYKTYFDQPLPNHKVWMEPYWDSDFIATSTWRATPPNDDSRGAWQVTGSGYSGRSIYDAGSWKQLEYNCDGV